MNRNLIKCYQIYFTWQCKEKDKVLDLKEASDLLASGCVCAGGGRAIIHASFVLLE